MWKILLDFALNLVRKQLLPRISWHPAPTALLEKGIELAEKVKDIFTDDVENNKGQLSVLWDQECVEVLALGVRGVASAVKRDNAVKQKVVAILADALDDIMEDDKIHAVALLDRKMAASGKKAVVS